MALIVEGIVDPALVECQNTNAGLNAQAFNAKPVLSYPVREFFKRLKKLEAQQWGSTLTKQEATDRGSAEGYPCTEICCGGPVPNQKIDTRY